MVNNRPSHNSMLRLALAYLASVTAISEGAFVLVIVLAIVLSLVGLGTLAFLG